MALVRWMSTGMGRWARIVLGLALLAIGYLMGGTWGVVVAVVGLVPILAAALNVCLFAPLFGAPLSGRRASAGG